MDHAHVLQRAGRNLSSLDGRNHPAPRGSPRARELYRSAVPFARRNHYTDLYGGVALLRRQSLARLPQYPATDLTGPRETALSFCASNMYRDFSMRPVFRHFLALFTAAMLLSAPALAFQSPLSDEAVRAAYFLGQRHDESMARALSRYTQFLPPPETGPHIYS